LHFYLYIIIINAVIIFLHYSILIFRQILEFDARAFLSLLELSNTFFLSHPSPFFRYSFHSPFSGSDLIGRILLDFAQVTLNPSPTTARERMAAILADQRQRVERLIRRHAPLDLHAHKHRESLSINKSQCATGDCFVVNPSRRLLTQPAFSTFSLCLFRKINTSALFSKMAIILDVE